MSKPLDFIGQKFGYLTVIERAKNYKTNSTQWLCQCICGKNTIVLAQNLKRGLSKSCGCNGSFVDSNKKYGKLIPIKIIKSGTNYSAIWRCKCDCGKYKNVSGNCLISSGTKSCGCLRFVNLKDKIFGSLTVIRKLNKKRSNNNKSTNNIWLCVCECGNKVSFTSAQLKNRKSKVCGVNCKIRLKNSFINHFFGTYNRKTKNPKKKFLLSFEQFIQIIFSPCKYCNSVGTNRSKSICNTLKINRKKRKNKTKLKRSKKIKLKDILFIVNGVDRINSNKCYTKNNCVPCCEMCNWMKNNYSRKEFLEQVKRIAKHNKMI